MDICRGVLRALFLDYPLSKVFDKVCGNVSVGDFLGSSQILVQSPIFYMKEQYF